MKSVVMLFNDPTIY